MSIKYFDGLGHFSEFLQKQTAMMVPVGEIAVREIGKTLRDEVKKLHGDNEKLETLADATQESRERLGYSANEPLLRDGSLLRDKVEMSVGVDWVSVGSNEPVAAYHEFGYVNARTGRLVPPRAVYREGLRNAIPKAIEITEEIVGIQLGVAPTGARMVELNTPTEE